MQKTQEAAKEKEVQSVRAAADVVDEVSGPGEPDQSGTSDLDVLECVQSDSLDVLQLDMMSDGPCACVPSPVRSARSSLRCTGRRRRRSGI